MSALIPFEKASLPAELASLFSAIGDDDLTSGISAGFPVISIKGKVFHLNRGGDKTLITKPDSDDPAASLELVILKANPHISKVYYVTGYVEGSDDKPDCYSNNGDVPAPDAQSPQSSKCSVCPHAQWGSKITESGKKAKACNDSRRLAVAPLGQLNDPMLLRIPATSLDPLKQYGDMVKKRGLKYNAVGTKIGFDYTVAHPALTFKPMGMLPADLLRQVAEIMNSDAVNEILGSTGFDAVVEVPAKPTEPVEAPAPEPEVVAPTPKKAKATSAFAATPEPEVVAEAPKKPAAKKPPVVVDDDLDSQLNAMLAGAGFDDGEDDE